jgi:hypothetical protein
MRTHKIVQKKEMREIENNRQEGASSERDAPSTERARDVRRWLKVSEAEAE